MTNHVRAPSPRSQAKLKRELTLLACSAPPEGRSRWTLQLLADKLVELKLVDSISDVADVSAKKNELKPWLVKSWVIAKPSATVCGEDGRCAGNL